MLAAGFSLNAHMGYGRWPTRPAVQAKSVTAAMRLPKGSAAGALRQSAN